MSFVVIGIPLALGRVVFASALVLGGCTPTRRKLRGRLASLAERTVRRVGWCSGACLASLAERTVRRVGWCSAAASLRSQPAHEGRY
ncbi:hypothetical protein [Nocardioides sp. TF02-7]|uniref:hypothetical protein n=1 Tax=Nocardioides sp. TF02-7 TaxID=2917724 RepID=UPI001F06D98A|nr:hypothetical protein [Nocardioides sp. TF02-7]UMG91959.1 hypothetical protein MF408_18375 [Nocardioides sp. TF02-7]